MSVCLLNEKYIKLYNDYISNQPNASIYHTLEWKNVLEKSFGYKPFYFIALENNQITGVLPSFEIKSIVFKKRLVSLPFSQVTKILYDNENILNELINFAYEFYEKGNYEYIEIKHGKNFLTLNKVENFYETTLNLDTSLDTIWKNFDAGSVRWGIRKAQKNNVEIKTDKDLKDIKNFYRLFAFTRKRLGVPVYSFPFFQNMFDLLKEKVKLYLAYYNNICIAGIIVFYFNKIATYAYSASINKREFLKLQPTNLLLWTAIKDAHLNHYKLFNFGITHISNQGLLNFKKRWGTITKKIPYYYIINQNKIPIIDRESKKVKIVSDIFRKLPMPIYKLISRIIIKGLG